MNNTSVFTLITIIQHSFGSPNYGNQRKEKKKEMQIGKEDPPQPQHESCSFQFHPSAQTRATTEG